MIPSIMLTEVASGFYICQKHFAFLFIGLAKQ